VIDSRASATIRLCQGVTVLLFEQDVNHALSEPIVVTSCKPVALCVRGSQPISSAIPKARRRGGSDVRRASRFAHNQEKVGSEDYGFSRSSMGMYDARGSPI
jgi:hypothetical protein